MCLILCHRCFVTIYVFDSVPWAFCYYAFVVILQLADVDKYNILTCHHPTVVLQLQKKGAYTENLLCFVLSYISTLFNPLCV